MVVVRCTRRLLQRLGRRPARNVSSTTALGDWYATILFTRPHHVVLLVNATTRLPVVIPAREVSTIPGRFASGLAAVLATLQIPTDIMAAELREMKDVVFSTTTSRSVLGTMNDFASHIEWTFHDHSGVTLHGLSLELADTPVGPLTYDRPRDVAYRYLCTSNRV